MLAPSYGEIRCDSRPALCRQNSDAALFERFAADDVAFGPRNRGVRGKTLVSLVKRSMDEAGIPYAEYAERQTAELSGGENDGLPLRESSRSTLRCCSSTNRLRDSTVLPAQRRWRSSARSPFRDIRCCSARTARTKRILPTKRYPFGTAVFFSFEVTRLHRTAGKLLKGKIRCGWCRGLRCADETACASRYGADAA